MGAAFSFPFSPLFILGCSSMMGPWRTPPGGSSWHCQTRHSASAKPSRYPLETMRGGYGLLLSLMLFLMSFSYALSVSLTLSSQISFVLPLVGVIAIFDEGEVLLIDMSIHTSNGQGCPFGVSYAVSGTELAFSGMTGSQNPSCCTIPRGIFPQMSYPFATKCPELTYVSKPRRLRLRTQSKPRNRSETPLRSFDSAKSHHLFCPFAASMMRTPRLHLYCVAFISEI